MLHLTARRKKGIRGSRPTVRTPKISGAMKREEMRMTGRRMKEMMR